MYRQELRKVKTDHGWVPMSDLRKRPSGEPIVFPWEQQKRRPDYGKAALWIFWLILGGFLLSLAASILILFGPLIGLGIILALIGRAKQ